MRFLRIKLLVKDKFSIQKTFKERKYNNLNALKVKKFPAPARLKPET